MTLRIVGVLLLLALAAIPKVLGAPPPNPDPSLAPWFQSLKRLDANGNEIRCCDLSDCRGVPARVGSNGYEVRVDRETFAINDATWLTRFGSLDPQWVPVPNETILQGRDNPVGRPVVCWTPWRNVICFVRAAEI